MGPINQPGFWWNLAFGVFVAHIGLRHSEPRFHKETLRKNMMSKLVKLISVHQVQTINYRYMHGIRCCFLFLTVSRVVFFSQISGSQVLFCGWKSTCCHQEGGARLTLVSGKTLGQSLWQTENMGGSRRESPLGERWTGRQGWCTVFSDPKMGSVLELQNPEKSPG